MIVRQSRRWLRANYTIHPLRRPLAAVPFTQSARHDEANKPPDPKSGRSNGEEQKKQKPGGSYTKVFGVFALGVPVGWLVSQYNGREQSNAGIAQPSEFVKYTLAGKEEVSSTCSIFTLKPATGVAVDTTQLHDNRAITSVQFKQPQLQIARSYTTLPDAEGQDAEELRFLIRREQKGEVSGYLHRLPIGADVEVRGPSLEYLLPEEVKKVVFLAGGTGIAPALQIADKLKGEADVHVLWASRKREDCEGGVSDSARERAAAGWNFFGWFSPFGLPSSDVGKAVVPATSRANAVVARLDGLKQRGSGDAGLKIDYYVDEEGTFIRPRDLSQLVQRAGNSDSGSASRLLLVSGPQGFINYWAGPKQWVGGREVQGPLGGVLATLGLRGWTVVKL